MSERRRGSTAVNWFEEMERHIQDGGGRLRPFALEIAPNAADCGANLGLAALLCAAAVAVLLSLVTAGKLTAEWERQTELRRHRQRQGGSHED